MLARAPEVQKHSESTTPAEGRGLDLDTVFTKLHQLKLSLLSTIMTCHTKFEHEILKTVDARLKTNRRETSLTNHRPPPSGGSLPNIKSPEMHIANKTDVLLLVNGVGNGGYICCSPCPLLYDQCVNMLSFQQDNTTCHKVSSRVTVSVMPSAVIGSQSNREPFEMWWEGRHDSQPC